MKKLIFMFMALVLVSSLAFAVDEPTATLAAPDTASTATTPVIPESAVLVTPEPASEVTATMATDAVVNVPETITLKGEVIDNLCAGANKEALAEFVKTHTKECALKPECLASGYSIFADDRLYTLDKDSSAKVEEFLKQADSKLQVTITAKQVGDELNLLSIENQN